MSKRVLENVTKASMALFAIALLAAPARAQHTFDGNILVENGVDSTGTAVNYFTNDPGSCGTLLSTLQASPHNSTYNLLSDITAGTGVSLFVGDPRHPTFALRPNDGSIADGNAAITAGKVAEIVSQGAPACTQCPEHRVFEQTCFRGAVPPTSQGVNWVFDGGWLCLEDFGDCSAAAPAALTTWGGTYGPGGATPGVAFVMDAAHSHLLQGKVTILAGATLTIEAGTFVFGENASGGYLTINRDADIIANGTKDAPIVMTSDLINPTPGGWGGLVIHGKAIANCADCLGGASCVSEGGAGSFCGTDDCDNSGSLRYVRCQFSGIEISPDNELNSFTFNGVGNGTTVDFLQAHRGSDDSFEWFGGTMNASHLFSSGNQDDGLDWQMGFRGTVQFAVVVSYFGGDKSIEADNNEFGFDTACRSNPLLANLTLIGPTDPADAVGGIHLRRGTDANIFNSIIYSTSGPGLRLQHAETCARGANPYPSGNATCNSASDAPVVAAGAVKDIDVRTYPNPVVNETQFEFSLPTAGQVSLALYDVAGREIDRVLETNMEAGPHTVTWAPAANLAAGAYFYRLEGEQVAKTGKLMLVK